MGDQTPVEYVALPAAAFPFRVDYVALETDVIVLTQNIDGPGAFTVPGLAEDYGPCKVVFTWPNGHTEVGLPSSCGEPEVRL